MDIKSTNETKSVSKSIGIIEADDIVVKVPWLDRSWSLSQAILGKGLELRQTRAVEWVEMVRNNQPVFTQEVLSDERFQDGFVVALEKYLIERNEGKRKIARNIFLGFAKAEDKEKFPLERFTHTLSQLSEIDIEVLRDTKVEEYGQNYQIYGNNPNRIDNIYNLIGLGLLLNTTGTRGGYDPKNSPFVNFSPFGREFIEYIKNGQPNRGVKETNSTPMGEVMLNVSYGKLHIDPKLHEYELQVEVYNNTGQTIANPQLEIKLPSEAIQINSGGQVTRDGKMATIFYPKLDAERVHPQKTTKLMTTANIGLYYKMNDNIYWDKDLMESQFEVTLYGEDTPPITLKKPFKGMQCF